MAANQYFIQCRKLWDQRLLVFASHQSLVKVDHFRFFLLIVALQKVVSASTYSAKPVELLSLCDDCDELVQFLKYPTEIQRRFKVSKSRRRHIHEQLESSGVDATDTTERVGNPNTLVVTKNNALYEREVKKH